MPTMSAVMCESCGRAIPPGERAYVVNGEATCALCYQPPGGAAAPGDARRHEHRRSEERVRWFRMGFFVTSGGLLAFSIFILVLWLIGRTYLEYKLAQLRGT